MPTERGPIDERTKRRVVQLYQQGKKTAEITEATGVGRSSIYFLLQQAGVRPSRQRGGGAVQEEPIQAKTLDGDDLTRWLVEYTGDLESENETLREWNAKLRTRIRELLGGTL